MITNNNSIQKKILNIDEVATYTGLSKSTIYKKCSEKRIPYYKQAKHSFFKREEVENWLLKHRIHTVEEITEYGIENLTDKKERVRA